MSYSNELAIQSEAVAKSAVALPDGDTRDAALRGARTLKTRARTVAKAEALRNPILVIDAKASTDELHFARRRQSVRCGVDLYIPGWKEVSVGMPDVFLRSALFAARTTPLVLNEQEIACEKDVSIYFSGETLSQFDQSVFVTCLSSYRDRPLGRPTEGGEAATDWISTTFYKFAEMQGISWNKPSNKENSTYGGTRQKLEDSFLRLRNANLSVRVGGFNIQMPQLVEAAFSNDSKNNEVKSGSDTVAFRITESIASYFGPSMWSIVPRESLEKGTLQSWLAGFYATHSKPSWVGIDYLRTHSGSMLEFAEFRGNLKDALHKLSDKDVAFNSRIRGYTISEDGTKIKVWLTSWQKRLAVSADEDTKGADNGND